MGDRRRGYREFAAGDVPNLEEKTVEEVKQLVQDGTITAQYALEQEQKGRNRFELILWLNQYMRHDN